MQNVEPDRWAPGLWKSTHWMAAALPSGPLSDELKQATTSHAITWCYLIPCETCRDHYNEFVHKIEPKFVTGEDVRSWWLKCHNYINRILKKPEWGQDQLNQTYSITKEPATTISTHALVPYSKPLDAFDIQQYMTSHPKTSVGARKVLGFVSNGRWMPSTAKAQPHVQRARLSVATYGNARTNQWRANLQRKTGAGTGAPPKKKGCKKCGKR